MKYIPKHTTAEYLAWIDNLDESLTHLIAHFDRDLEAQSHRSEPDWAIVEFRDIAIKSKQANLANRDVLVNKESGLPENGAYLYEYQRSWDDGYNTCLAELRAKIASKLDEVM